MMETYIYKIDKIKNLFKCDVCLQLLKEPVALTCGSTVCKSHLEDLSENGVFQCEKCHEEHTAPTGGFNINNIVQDALNNNLDSLKASPIFEQCKVQIEHAAKSISDIEYMPDDPENYVYEYFEDIKRQVDLRREELKLKIDEYSDEIITVICETQSSLRKSCLSVTNSHVNASLTLRLKADLNKLIKKLDTLEIDNDIYQNINKEIRKLRDELDRIPFNYQQSLIQGKEFSFTFKNVTIDQHFFGCFGDSKRFGDSTILDSYLQKKLIDLCNFQNQKWKLIYRATQQGFSGNNFHSVCNGTANTLTVIKATNGNIFGGFIVNPWNTNGWIKDSKAYIFSLVNYNYKPFKTGVLNSSEACYSVNKNGPSFGNKDIWIASDSNENQNSESTLGKSYTLPKYLKCDSILAGTTYFKTVDIEVFTKD